MNHTISTVILSTATIEGFKLAAAVTVPTLAQDVVTRLANSSLNKIRNGNIRTLVELTVRFTASVVTAGAMAYALSMPMATILTINALFILTIGCYTVFCGNSFTIAIDKLLLSNHELRQTVNSQKQDIAWLKTALQSAEQKANSQEKQARLFQNKCRQLLTKLKDTKTVSEE